MSRSFDTHLLLNRQALNRLHQAGLSALAADSCDINSARKLALWNRRSGAEIYLFSLLTAAARYMALHYFIQSDLQPALDRVIVAGTAYPLPDMTPAFREFLLCYPREELAIACHSGENPQKRRFRQRLLAEMFVLEVMLENPAARSFLDLFDDHEFITRFDYHDLLRKIVGLPGRVQQQAIWNQSLPELLRAPMRAAPDSLAEQVAYVIRHWAPWLPEAMLSGLQLAGAIMIEENRPHLPGPGPSLIPMFGKGDEANAPAAFTTDIDWMASTVLLAKSVYVWLDQLSNRYQRSVKTLSEIPDEELAELAHQGFNALWLIGIWERSGASRRIKQLCGNPEAEASAYALHAYRVAEDLGGEGALQNLEHRCQRHGIRLACDVVPNHTGIDSEWIIEHPDWFLQAEQPPYPAYRFSGPNLCHADGISIRIEDGYWDHSDAAVVCEYHNHHTGRRRYIYHGNDGTHMPWNDTAQLNFLMPEVRQAMSDLIIAIAQRFSLIRFDAAMTLARKHFRRLWFPPPGGSAGVPSRSAFWMSDDDFDKAFPVEFWREVVDRINREAPNTLLIAEAFWLMESYFVRTLGMHRVYNSAFMNMLKREENTKYRKIIKDILAYNPEILKRYVNFMNNPDEATAVEQFDKGDKYFGVATLLATLPGLPMFGHGQIEGFREKYGMEYRRAYWAEEPDTGFVAHHERQIFPLLRKRKLFAGVEHFSLYDFTTATGVDENVYAFSNGSAGDKVLVVYNNAAHGTEGRLHSAAPKASAEHEGAPHPMPPLWQELGMGHVIGQYCRFRNLQGAEYLRPVEQLSYGLALQLEAYGHHVFHDFKILDDAEGFWQKLHRRLQDRAVDNLDREFLKMRYQPLWDSFSELLNPKRLHVLAGGLTATPQTAPVRSLIEQLTVELQEFAAALQPEAKIDNDSWDEHIALGKQLTALASWLAKLPAQQLPGKLLVEAWSGTRRQKALGVPLLYWLLLHNLGSLVGCTEDSDCLKLLHRYGLDYAWHEHNDSVEKQREVGLTALLMKTSTLDPHPAISEATFSEMCHTPIGIGLLGINIYAGRTWFLQEGMTSMAGAVALQSAVLQLMQKPAEDKESAIKIAHVLRQRLARAAAVGYQLDKFFRLE